MIEFACEAIQSKTLVCGKFLNHSFNFRTSDWLVCSYFLFLLPSVSLSSWSLSVSARLSILSACSCLWWWSLMVLFLCSALYFLFFHFWSLFFFFFGWMWLKVFQFYFLKEMAFGFIDLCCFFVHFYFFCFALRCFSNFEFLLFFL